MVGLASVSSSIIQLGLARYASRWQVGMDLRSTSMGTIRRGVA